MKTKGRKRQRLEDEPTLKCDNPSESDRRHDFMCTFCHHLRMDCVAWSPCGHLICIQCVQHILNNLMTPTDYASGKRPLGWHLDESKDERCGVCRDYRTRARFSGANFIVLPETYYALAEEVVPLLVAKEQTDLEKLWADRPILGSGSSSSVTSGSSSSSSSSSATGSGSLTSTTMAIASIPSVNLGSVANATTAQPRDVRQVFEQQQQKNLKAAMLWQARLAPATAVEREFRCFNCVHHVRRSVQVSAQRHRDVKDGKDTKDMKDQPKEVKELKTVKDLKPSGVVVATQPESLTSGIPTASGTTRYNMTRQELLRHCLKCRKFLCKLPGCHEGIDLEFTEVMQYAIHVLPAEQNAPKEQDIEDAWRDLALEKWKHHLLTNCKHPCATDRCCSAKLGDRDCTWLYDQRTPGNNCTPKKFEEHYRTVHEAYHRASQYLTATERRLERLKVTWNAAVETIDRHLRVIKRALPWRYRKLTPHLLTLESTLATFTDIQLNSIAGLKSTCRHPYLDKMYGDTKIPAPQRGQAAQAQPATRTVRAGPANNTYTTDVDAVERVDEDDSDDAEDNMSIDIELSDDLFEVDTDTGDEG